MKTALGCLAVLMSTSLTVVPSAAAKDLKELSVLYIGSERSAEFITFLKANVARVEAKSRQDFQTDQAASFDVVLWSKLVPLGREKMAEWVDHDGQFLHPGTGVQLELDEDLVASGVPFDKPEFFERTLHDLRAGGTDAQRAKRLLERYAPSGPKAADPEQWSNSWQANKPYAFASDSSDYCWYIDSLAKKRGTPTTHLRGPKRADVPAKGD